MAIKPACQPDRVHYGRATVTLLGVVQKILSDPGAGQPEKVQIAVRGAEELYMKIRIENSLKNRAGEEVRLLPGAEVEITISALPTRQRPYPCFVRTGREKRVQMRTTHASDFLGFSSLHYTD